MHFFSITYVPHAVLITFKYLVRRTNQEHFDTKR
jgi:hypothetical protein